MRFLVLLCDSSMRFVVHKNFYAYRLCFFQLTKLLSIVGFVEVEVETKFRLWGNILIAQIPTTNLKFTHPFHFISFQFKIGFWGFGVLGYWPQFREFTV